MSDTGSRGMPGAAGAISGLCVKTIFAPVDRIRLVLQNETLAKSRIGNQPLNTASNAVFRLYKEQGFLSLWRGNGANCLRTGPTYFLRFFLYDRLKHTSIFGSEKLSNRVAAGALSGAVVCCATYPMEVIRVRLAADLTSTVSNYRGIIDCLRSSYKAEGARCFFKGMGVSVLEIAPFMGISLGTYDYVSTHMMEGKLSKFKKCMLGATTTIFAAALCYPLDTIRRQLILDGSNGYHSRYNESPLLCGRKLFAEGGMPRLYKGFSLVAFRAPAMGLTLVLQDCCNKYLSLF